MIQRSTTGVAPATAGAAPADDCIISVRNVSKSFGGVAANADITFDVKVGSVTALIGPNGAGKTTLFNAMTGFGRPDSGSVTMAGREVHRMQPHQVARIGMIRTFQSIRMLPDLTVYESLLVARQPGRGRAERATATLRRLGLESVANRQCTTLPLLAQRKVEVARALMCQPKVILLDEPSAGATVSERNELADLIAELRADGTTIVVIEHNVPFVMQVSDQIVVLDFGKVVAIGTPAEIASDPIVQEIYLGV
ncbi:MAG: transporter ATP-binding protein [Pseudonocardiales bacterium]|nr:transporter ATP-binding protein [Pseudonocardiales bacterium]